jgi:hypothetical protein
MIRTCSHHNADSIFAEEPQRDLLHVGLRVAGLSVVVIPLVSGSHTTSTAASGRAAASGSAAVSGGQFMDQAQQQTASHSQSWQDKPAKTSQRRPASGSAA